ncbi:hypothetical protein HDU98_000725 [Podochytrium sp. JEL0797]|nr:hypothetical protein HDU98_000725 [Podochytrium sp. JEL0797]
MTPQPPLFYNPYQDWNHTLAHQSDLVRQILFTVIVVVFGIICRTAAKIAARGNPHVLAQFWLGSDLSVLLPHCFAVLKEHKKAHHFTSLPIVVLGLLFLALSMAGSTILSQFSPLQTHTKGLLMGSLALKKSVSPQSDLVGLLYSPTGLDQSKTYQLDPDTFFPLNSTLGLGNFSDVQTIPYDFNGADIYGLPIQVQRNGTGSSGIVDCLMVNLGCDGSPGAAGFQSTTLTLKIFCPSTMTGGISGPFPLSDPNAFGASEGAAMTNIDPGLGDDIVVQSPSQVSWLKYQTGSVISGEVIMQDKNFSYAGLAQWNTFLNASEPRNRHIDAICNQTTIYALNATTTFPHPATFQCNGVSLNGSLVTFASFRGQYDDQYGGSIWFTTATYNVSTIGSHTPILSPAILSHGVYFVRGGGGKLTTSYSSAWLVVPGHSRSDAYSLVMANAVLSDNNVTMPFYSVALHPEFALAIPLLVLAVFSGLLLLLIGAMKLVALGMRRKQKEVDFEIKYVLFKSAGGLSEKFKSTHVWNGELKDLELASGDAAINLMDKNSYKTFGSE